MEWAGGTGEPGGGGLWASQPRPVQAGGDPPGPMLPPAQPPSQRLAGAGPRPEGGAWPQAVQFPPSQPALRRPDLWAPGSSPAAGPFFSPASAPPPSPLQLTPSPPRPAGPGAPTAARATAKAGAWFRPTDGTGGGGLRRASRATASTQSASQRRAGRGGGGGAWARPGGARPAAGPAASTAADGFAARLRKLPAVATGAGVTLKDLENIRRQYRTPAQAMLHTLHDCHSRLHAAPRGPAAADHRAGRGEEAGEASAAAAAAVAAAIQQGFDALKADLAAVVQRQSAGLGEQQAQLDATLEAVQQALSAAPRPATDPMLPPDPPAVQPVLALPAPPAAADLGRCLAPVAPPPPPPVEGSHGPLLSDASDGGSRSRRKRKAALEPAVVLRPKKSPPQEPAVVLRPVERPAPDVSEWEGDLLQPAAGSAGLGATRTSDSGGVLLDCAADADAQEMLSRIRQCQADFLQTQKLKSF